MHGEKYCNARNYYISGSKNIMREDMGSEEAMANKSAEHEVIDRIWELVEKKGWNDYQFANNCGICASTVNKWRYHNVRSVSRENILKVCKGLGITESEFYSFGEIPKKIQLDEFPIDEFARLDSGEKKFIAKFVIFLSKKVEM